MSNILELMNCRVNDNTLNEIIYRTDNINRSCEHIIDMIIEADDEKMEKIKKIFETT